jgi:hypothetical protein
MSWLFVVYHVPVFEVSFLDWYCSEDIEMSYDFVLRFAISREVARFATVVTVVVLLFVAVAIFVAKLFLWFPLLDYVKVHWFRSSRLVMSTYSRSKWLSCPSVIGFAWCITILFLLGLKCLGF